MGYTERTGFSPNDRGTGGPRHDDGSPTTILPSQLQGASGYQNSPSGGQALHYITNVALGAHWTYVINVNGSTISLSVNGSKTRPGPRRQPGRPRAQCDRLLKC
jgi:hypothetical protein